MANLFYLSKTVALRGHDPLAADNDRWRLISMVFALPVTGFFIINLMNEHEHVEPPPDYPYLKMANRVGRKAFRRDFLFRYERLFGENGLLG